LCATHPGEEGIEAEDEVPVASEEHPDLLDDAVGVDSGEVWGGGVWW
jgi:hypothetical protein